MAFTPRTWLGRQVEHPGRIQLIATADPTVFDVVRFEGKVEQEGDFLGTTNLNDLEQRIFTGLAAGTGGAANNALALGGVAAANYVQNTTTATTLTKINAWSGGNVRLSVAGKTISVGVFGGSITGTQNTFIAMLPANIIPSLGWIVNSNGIYIRSDGSGNYGVYGSLATIPSETYIVFVAQ